jgi:hypothetical protein
MMKVKPAPGLKIRDPITQQFIDPEGWEVDEKDMYWYCRLRDGDVVPADDAAADETSSNAKPASKKSAPSAAPDASSGS